MTVSELVIGCYEEHAIDTCGGKALALWKLKEEGFNIPEWFVITPRAFADGALKAEAQEAITDLVERFSFSQAPLAIRSSSVEEDAASSSFAGQFESYLGVAAAEIGAFAQKVWKSGYAQRVDAYKSARGESTEFRAPAIIVQRLIDADAAGVAFSVDPISGDWNRCLVSALLGLGSTLVDGEADADTYVFDRQGNAVKCESATKGLRRSISKEPPFSIIEEDLDEPEASRLSLPVEQASDVAALARRCERFFGRPQDIEWAIESGELFLLQSRPITTLQNVVNPTGKLYIWDNSNIAESYSGITLPLTFSFARYIYTEVYRQFCLILKVSPEKVYQHRALFGQMLGLIRGRVYYNLLSWYKVLALLPGYSLNQGFMEQMMGVKEPLSEDAQKEVEIVKSNESKWVDLWRLSQSLASLLWKHWTIERDTRRFYKRLEASLGSLKKPLADMRLEELADHFHDLERDLLTKWDAPLVNDFIAMVFFGLLKSLCQKWIGDESDAIHNDLICEMGNIISAEPARRIKFMATIASKDSSLSEALRSGSHGSIRKAVASSPELERELENYFNKFGDRCLDELKLESISLIDNPIPLYRSIGELALHGQNSPSASKGSPKDTRQADAENKAFQTLKGKPFRKIAFRYVLKHARKRVSGRENLRFERTRLFGRVRRIFLEMGKRLAAFNAIGDARDVFYLEIYEIIGYIEGTGVTTDLGNLIGQRKAEYDQYAAEDRPDDRFQTRGPVPIANRFKSVSSEPDKPSSPADLRGIGCCPGVVSGTARVVRDPQSAHLKRGEILVARQTDPGWIMLFPLASGLLVERGSLLSHSAIVSRELGLPAIVSIKGLLDTVRTGDRIEFDGSSGIIRIAGRGQSDRIPQD